MMIKYNLIENDNVVASNMNLDTAFLFAKTYMQDVDQITIKRVFIEDNFENTYSKKIVEPKPKNISTIMPEPTEQEEIDTMSLFE